MTSRTSTTSIASPEPPSIFASPHLPQRLGLPFDSLLFLSTTFSFCTGALLGSALGGRVASLRFTAENAHRLPKSERGWYLYYKSKNYATMLGAMKEGAKNGLRISIWTGAFVGTQALVDRVRGKVDVGGTVVAAGTVAGGFTLWNRLSYGLAVRTAKKGLIFGVLFGVAQDVLRVLKGEDQVKYLYWLPPYLKNDPVAVEREEESPTNGQTKGQVETSEINEKRSS